MAKITIGGSYDHSKSNIRAELSAESTMDLTVGETRDMSEREISIVEREKNELSEAPVVAGWRVRCP